MWPKSERKRFNPQAYPETVRDLVEIDYAKKLSSDEKSWLASFNETEYGANPEHLEFITGSPPTLEEKRKSWREIQRYKRDTLTAAPRGDFALYLYRYDRDIAETAQSNEDQLIELLDRQYEVELIMLERLKELIMEKDWYGKGKQNGSSGIDCNETARTCRSKKEPGSVLCIQSQEIRPPRISSLSVRRKRRRDASRD